MAFETLEVRIEEDGVTIVALKHPPVNALSTKVLEELGLAIEELVDNTDCRALVITGEGRYFSAGADMKELATRANEIRADYMKFVERGHRVFRSLELIPQPVIAAINGVALGGGLELALACDIRIAGEATKVGLPEVAYGLMPAYGGTQRLARLVGLAKARELVFTGEVINADEALRIGLVNMKVPSGHELKAAREMGATIAQKAPIAVAAAKRAMLAGYDKDLEEGLKGETKAFESVSSSDDLAEGLAAFVERRKPRFTGK
jgi:enoyl-CoA hydratase/carnithine racemase